MFEAHLAFTLGEAAEMMEGKIQSTSASEPSSRALADIACRGVSTDTRSAQPGNLFFALRGGSFDGPNYLPQAASAGCVAAVVDHLVESDIPQILVENVGVAYGHFAREMRPDVPIVMVVGSNGKTTTTQLAAFALRVALGGDYVQCTAGNFNNEVGVPQTLLSITPEHRCAVVEAGINHPGEMARLTDWINPTYVVITNAHREHQEFLAGTRESARENGLAILRVPEHGAVVAPAHDPEFPVWRDLAMLARAPLVTYSTNPAVKALIQGELKEDGAFLVRTPERDYTLHPNNTAPHHLHNLLAVAALIWSARMDIAYVVPALETFNLLEGRGATYILREKALTVIDEAYNANPDSVKATLLALSRKTGEKRIYVLGDMGEQGEEAPRWHTEMGLYAKELGIDEFVSVGPLSRMAAEAFGEGAVSFETADEAYEYLCNATGVITVKASHFMRLDRLVDKLTARREKNTESQKA